MLFLATTMSIAAVAQSFSPFQEEQQTQKLLNFLTTSLEQTGVTYRGTIGNLMGSVLPLSFYSTARYFGDYIGSLPGVDLQVRDDYSPKNYTLTPKADSPGRELQLERVCIYNGINIQDGALWQMALGVCREAGLTSALGTDLLDTASNQNQLLSVGFAGNAFQDQAGIHRATTSSVGTYSYNNSRILTAKNAYFFRCVPRNWIATDPFLGTSYMSYITNTNLPANPQYMAGNVTWMDWQPMTKENVWAFFIGPLQTSYIRQQALGDSFVSFWTTAVQNAMGTLFALRYMQSELGAMYDTCKGTLNDARNDVISPYLASVDTSAATLAGLMILQRILQDELQFETTLNAADKQQIHLALNSIRIMLFGGETPKGLYTKGLLAFFKNNAWDKTLGTFHFQGEANNPRMGDDWRPHTEVQAVEANVWSTTVLGQPLLDSWYGFGACYRLWQAVRTWGGFFGPDQLLWGMGYSDMDGNGVLGDHEEGVIAATSTASAINMLRALITQYTLVSQEEGNSFAEEAGRYVSELKQDHDSMLQRVLTLRSDMYSQEEAYDKVRAKEYSKLICLHEDVLAFIDVSKRYKVPYSSYANPLPGTAATSWALLLNYSFNPFKVGGNYLPVVFGAEL